EPNCRGLLIVRLELVLIAWIAAGGKPRLSGSFWHAMLEHPLLQSPPTPWLGRLLFAAAFAAAVWRAWPRNGPLDVGLAAVLASCFVAGERARTPGRAGAC